MAPVLRDNPEPVWMAVLACHWFGIGPGLVLTGSEKTVEKEGHYRII